MNVTYRCRQCGRTNRQELAADAGAADRGASALACAGCGDRIAVPEGAVAAGTLRRCAVCPSTDLFVRKDFPQRLGVIVVLAGFAASCVAWYWHLVYATFAILFATALVDVLLYVLVAEAVVCYRCGAHYRGLEEGGGHAAFNLETHERYRQQAARLAQPPADRPSHPLAGSRRGRME